ncbi:hypothetical protein J8Z24_21290 (plasmid) [Pseudoalteromonas sp. SCSIO 43201]|uniref:hypothetical protein n=1 Tax=Pseudoalteromonas TaxID=53246 RepID=UPI0020764279|nr:MULTISPECIES: hypothetical protein [Pseudoalteromonas]MDW7551344.1 hypothetical protein [Pseudoalteromonas peptidolytica]USD31152.1 hypothetical protein J8Z24_21290 [Pseudoalteromonas sp. SCSIO 43201]
MALKEYQSFKSKLSSRGDRRALNLLSTLNLLRHDMLIDEQTIIKACLCAKTLASLKARLSAHLQAHAFTKNSITTYRSRLTQLATTYKQHINPHVLDEQANTGQRLMHYAAKYWPKKNKGQLHTLINEYSGIPIGTIKRWTSHDAQPRAQHVVALAKLETLFGLDMGTLTQCARINKQRSLSKHIKPKVPLPKQQPEIDTLPAHLQLQINALLDFKNKLVAPPLSQASFAMRKREALPLQGAGRWTTTPDGINSSAENFCAQVLRFFRWVVTSHDIEVQQLDLSMLTCVELLEGYTHACFRSEVYNTLLAFLTPLYGLCEANSGYLTRYHAPKCTWILYDGHSTEQFDGLDDWLSQSIYLHRQIGTWIRDTKHKINERRHDKQSSGSRNIHWLLDRPDADLSQSMAELQLMIEAMVEFADKITEPARQLLPLQVAVWLSLSIKTPLRISNWCAMQWLDAPFAAQAKTPVLYKDAGTYYLKVPRNWLKNRRSLEVTMIEAKIEDPFTIKLLNRLAAIRTQLAWPTMSDAVFIQTRDSKTRDRGAPYTRKALAKVIQQWTAKTAKALWPERFIENGINPHALRHFMATFVLDKTGDYGMAATKLMDSVAVVIKVYGKNDHETNTIKLKQLGL